MRKKSMIPAAYIFTDTVPDRFVTSYTSMIYEEFTFQEALNANPSKLPNLRNAAYIANVAGIVTPKASVFVIYTPNVKRLTMAQFGDADKLKVLINSMKRQSLLADYARAFTRLNDTAYAFALYVRAFQDLKLRRLQKDQRATLSLSVIQQNIPPTIQHLDALRQLLIHSFKNDLCF